MKQQPCLQPSIVLLHPRIVTLGRDDRPGRPLLRGIRRLFMALAALLVVGGAAVAFGAAPVVTFILPANGTTAGGTAVTIVGSGFSGPPAVSIGGMPATGVVVINDSMIDAVTPAVTAGAANVVVTNSDGPSTGGVALYTYGLAPIPAGAVWTDRTSAGSRSWQSIASSADGGTLAAVDYAGSGSGGDIWTSTDGGATWADRTSAGSRYWSSITSSADGTKLAAADYGGDIYTSTDGGATWTDRSSAGSGEWTSITSSADGSKLAAAAPPDFSIGDIYTSTNAGATWTDQPNARNGNWQSITSSADGSRLAAADYGDGIWTSVAAAPVVTTPTIASITTTGAALGGDVTIDGGVAITARGVVYSVTTTNNHPTIGGTGVIKVTASGTTGVFTVNSGTLTPGTGYSFAAYATNAVGTTYTSPVSTFTTVSLSTNASLSSLALSAGTLTPVFASGTIGYSAVVPLATTSVKVTPTVAVSTATVKVNGTAVTSGTASGAISLAFGANTLSVVVTAQDGTTSKTYTVVLYRGVKGDFNQDGKTDLVYFNPTTRATEIVYFNGSTVTGSVTGHVLSAGYVLIDVADMNGDGKPDYVLFDPTTRRTAIWYLNGAALVSSKYGPTLPAGYTLVGVADFNGDGHPDFVLLNTTTGKTAIWYMNNATYVSSVFGPTIPAGYSLVGVADFDADSHPDYVLFDATTRATAIWYMSGATYLRSAVGKTIAAGYKLDGVRDVNGDGRPDYILENAATHALVIWNMDNTTYLNGGAGPTPPAGFTLVSP